MNNFTIKETKRKLNPPTPPPPSSALSYRFLRNGFIKVRTAATFRKLSLKHFRFFNLKKNKSYRSYHSELGCEAN